MATAQKNPTKKVIKPGGDIIATTAGELREKIRGLVKKGVKDLTVDLSKVEMVDSVGLGLLIATHNSMNKVDGKLTVKNANENIYKLFRTMRLDQHFEVTMAG